MTLPKTTPKGWEPDVGGAWKRTDGARVWKAGEGKCSWVAWISAKQELVGTTGKSIRFASGIAAMRAMNERRPLGLKL